MSKILDVYGNNLTYRKCTLEDVDRHFRCVRRIVEPSTREEYKKRMRSCIEAGTAYCMSNSNVFLYYLKHSEDQYVAEGVSTSWVGRTVEWLALLTAMFFIEDVDIMFIEFYLHKKSDLQHFRTLVDPSSLQGQITFPTRIMIRPDMLREKVKKLGVV